jgi:multiple antibiotic resistance protein
MQEYIQAAITLLAVINPLICGIMLLQIEDQSTLKHRLFNATKAALAVLVVLVLSALLGKFILQVFGISIEVFKIVGGVVIAHIGFGMFGAKPQPDEDGQKRKETLTTLITFAASPGTIATIIALSVVHDAHGLPVIAMVGAGLAVLLTWLIMLVMLLGSGRIHIGSQHLFTRFLGLILISMGLQFVLTGLKDFMTG